MEPVTAGHLIFLLFVLPLYFPLLKLLISCLFSFLPYFRPKPPHAFSKTPTVERREKLGLETVFSTFDSDGDGFISEGELMESLRRLGLTATAGEVTNMMEKADTNGDGLIDFDEFKKINLSWGLVDGGGGDGGEKEEEVLREAFAVFDSNGDGKITVEELGMVLKSLGLKEGESMEACGEMVKKVDMDGDGMINFEEFKKMMVKEGKIF